MVSVHSTGYLRKEKKEKEIEKERKGEDWSAWPALIFRDNMPSFNGCTFNGSQHFVGAISGASHRAIVMSCVVSEQLHRRNCGTGECKRSRKRHWDECAKLISCQGMS